MVHRQTHPRQTPPGTNPPETDPPGDRPTRDKPTRGQTHPGDKPTRGTNASGDKSTGGLTHPGDKCTNKTHPRKNFIYLEYAIYVYAIQTFFTQNQFIHLAWNIPSKCYFDHSISYKYINPYVNPRNMIMKSITWIPSLLLLKNGGGREHPWVQGCQARRENTSLQEFWI